MAWIGSLLIIHCTTSLQGAIESMRLLKEIPAVWAFIE